jgi:hypothetical protein
MNSDDQKERDATTAGNKAKDASRVDSGKQGISNRPDDEHPDTGVDPAPGPPQAKDAAERNK